MILALAGQFKQLSREPEKLKSKSRMQHLLFSYIILYIYIFAGEHKRACRLILTSVVSEQHQSRLARKCEHILGIPLFFQLE